MIRKILAWRELLKLGDNREIKRNVNTFFRNNILRSLEKEGWFDYLQEPRSREEIAEHFGYTDLEFLDWLLYVLEDDGVIEKEDSRYVCKAPVEFNDATPRVFSESMVHIWKVHAEFLPERLKGKFLEFSGGVNLFNWDDALTTKIYEQIRRAAFVYTGALNKTGKFLDVGCGNGYGTAAIWSYYYKKGKVFADKKHIEIVGIDPDEDLLEIAKEEFSQMVKKHLEEEVTDMSALTLPSYSVGNVEEIPFEDETFDFVYASQVLHWTDARKAVEEMLRVTKKGGIVFGTQSFYPNSNHYNGLHFLVVEGAQGFFTKDEFTKWAYDAGARKVDFATPISVFVIRK